MLQTNLAFPHDLMLLFQQGGLEDAEVKEMITKAKRNFVESQMHSSSYKNDWWKTYVYDENGKRKEIVRKTEEELYTVLFDHYKRMNAPVETFEYAFKLLMKRKRNELGRSPQTILDDTRYFSYLSESLKKKRLSEITESDLRT